MEQLERFAENEPEVNGFLVLGLVELHATEAASLIERAFAARRVDLTIMGDWVDAQVELGLLPAEEAEQRRPRELPQTPFPTTARGVVPPPIPSREIRQRVA